MPIDINWIVISQKFFIFRVPIVLNTTTAHAHQFLFVAIIFELLGLATSKEVVWKSLSLLFWNGMGNIFKQ